MPFAGSMTYNGKQAEDYIIKPAFRKAALDDILKVVGGIKAKMYLAYLGRLAKVTKTDPGCGQGASTITIPRSEKMWDPSHMKVWIKECWTSAQTNIEEWWLNNGNEISTLDDTAYAEYILDVVTDAAFEDLIRLIWLGDKSITNSRMAQGASDVPNYNSVTGIWKRVFDGVGASSIKRLAIAKNTAGTTADDQMLAEGESVTILRGLLNRAPVELKQQDKTSQRLLVTRSIYDNYQDYRESQNLSESFVQMEDGKDRLAYRGVPLVIMDIWDKYIPDFIAAGRVDKPHRALLVVKDNLQVGFDSPVTDKVAFQRWDNMDTEEWNARAKYMLDTQITDDKYVAAAY